MIEVRAEVSREVMDELEDLVFELEDATRWNLFENFENKGYWVQGIFESDEDAKSAWAELASVASLTCEPSFSELEDKEWKDSYKEHFHPWSIGTVHWVPDWLRESYELPEGHQVVWLDPGLAFGTGNHGTTRLCVEQLIAFKETCSDLKTAKVVDAGCGSGILAISATKLGFSNVEAFDYDPEAVSVAIDNAKMNDVPSVDYFVGDLTNGFRGEKADCLMANILANILMKHAGELIDAVASGGTLILSGILGEEAERVRDFFEKQDGLGSGSITYMDEWSCIVFTRS